jgi:hypothetical protein
MKLLTPLQRLFGRKATVFALAAGLVTTIACWWWLPPTPLFRDEVTEANNTVSPQFSPRMNYAVYLDDDEKYSSRLASVWDLRTGEKCFSFKCSWRPDIWLNEDETLCVEFDYGKARLREMPTGVLKSPDQSVEFPMGSLIADAKGHLFILIGAAKQRPWLIRDLLTGEEAGSISLPPDKDFFSIPNYPGFIRVWTREKGNSALNELRQVPTGKLLWKETLNRNDMGDNELTKFIRITPDGKTTVRLYAGKVHLFDEVGNQRSFDWPRCDPPGPNIEDLSPDGRYLAFSGYKERAEPWLQKLYHWCGIRQNYRAVYLYDVKTGQEIGRFVDAWFGQISVDGNRLAVGGKEGWAVYDLPLRKPWPNIAGYALGVAASVFLLGLILGKLRRKKASVAA